MLVFRSRLREFLSDGELGQQYFAAMLACLDDCTEQYKLTLEPSPHPLTAYGERDPLRLYPGTLQLAEELSIKHPRVNGDGESRPWVMTTDLLLILRDRARPREVLAIAFKPNGWSKRPRKVELLRLEREYWLRRQVPWLLITPKQYNARVLLTLRRSAAWVFAEPATGEQRAVAATLGRTFNGHPLQRVLAEIAHVLGSMDAAQRALWQSVWNAELPLNLNRGWRPHLPIAVIDIPAFWAQNPIASRSSAWTLN